MCQGSTSSWRLIASRWKATTSKPCARMESVLRLESHDFQFVYLPRKANIADALSRLNSCRQLDTGEEYDMVWLIVENSAPVALSPKEIGQASCDDEELIIVKSCVRSGNWSQCTVPSYLHVKDELCVYEEL